MNMPAELSLPFDLLLKLANMARGAFERAQERVNNCYGADGRRLARYSEAMVAWLREHAWEMRSVHDRLLAHLEEAAVRWNDNEQTYEVRS